MSGPLTDAEWDRVRLRDDPANAYNMGWMPDCRTCAWHDGTLAVEWRREARKIIAGNFTNHTGRLLMAAYIEGMLRNMGYGDAADRPVLEAGAVVPLPPTPRVSWSERFWNWFGR